MKHIFLIFGISSSIARPFVDNLLSDGSTEVHGTYRSPSNALSLMKAEWGERLQMTELDVNNFNDIKEIAATVSKRAQKCSAQLSVLYTCGAWVSGNIGTVSEATLKNQMNVSIAAPYLAFSSVVKNFQGALRIAITTGLGGVQNAVAGNSVYAMTSGAIHSLVKSLGAELQGRPNSGCLGISIGLFDKGQHWFEAFENSIATKLPSDSSEPVLLLGLFFSGQLQSASGSMLELSGGLKNYEPLFEFRKGRGENG